MSRLHFPGMIRRAAGYTLIEAVVAIIIVGILAAGASVFLVHPIQGYVDLSGRAALVEAAESALRRMARDIRIALPNSVRVTNIVGGGFALELIPTIDGGRYCNTSDVVAGRCANDLNFNGDIQFDLLGCFRNAATPDAPGKRLVINNLGITDNDVYADGVTPAPTPPRVITPAATGVTIAQIAPSTCPTGGNHQVTLSASHQFRGGSSGGRVFVVQTPVTYLCTPNPATGTLVRYADYAIQATQPATALILDALSGVTKARVADQLSTCSVTTDTKQVRERGLVTLDISIATEGKTIRLIHQVQLDNSQ